MSPRYLVLLGDRAAATAISLRRLWASSDLTLAFASSRIAAFVNSACPLISLGETGCILGSLFPRHGPAERLMRLAAAEFHSIKSSNGKALLDNYWGGFVAAVETADGITILRDPSGTFPCYRSKAAGCSIFASDAELLVDAGVEIDVDFHAIGRQLYRAFVPSAETALSGVRELLAGFALRLVADEEKLQLWWSPWDHVTDSVECSKDTSEQLSRTVRHCVQAWASSHRRLLLSVSGGLDSSILAACLASSKTDTFCLTMFADDPGGDERAYARTLCDHLGLPLIERPYRLEDIDIAEPLAPHLPRPRDRTQANAYERVHLEVANEIGADAFVTGNGGDSVFGYSQSAAPVADRYLAEGLRRGVITSLIDVCSQTGCSMSDAVRQAWRLARTTPLYRVQPSFHFLAAEFRGSLGAADLHHPWLDAPNGALPGKAAHIASILRVQPNLEASRGYYLPVLSPLMSQPILEACLAIPSWEWRAGGRDRSLARRAFANELPRTILERRAKGGTSGFSAKLLDHFRRPIRDRLLGGRLAANRIIDSASIAEALRDEAPVGHLERVRILELVNAEAWIEHWTQRPLPGAGRLDIKSGAHAPLLSSAGPIP